MEAYSNTLEKRMLKILQDLSEISLQCQSRRDVFQRLVEIGQAGMESSLFWVAVIDFEQDELRQVACQSPHATLLEKLTQDKALNFRLQSHPWIELGQSAETYDLKIDEQEIIQVEVAQAYNLNAALIQPLQTHTGLLGYLFHLSSQTTEFSTDDRQLLEMLAHQAMATIESCDRHDASRRSARVFSELSTISNNLNKFTAELPHKTRELFGVPIAILWIKENKQGLFKVMSTSGDVDQAYSKLRLHFESERFDKLYNCQNVLYLPNIECTKYPLEHRDEVINRGWISLMSAPLKAEDKLIGILDIFTKTAYQFSIWEKELFRALADHAALSFRNAVLCLERENDLKDREKIQNLIEIMLKMTRATQQKQLFALLLQGALDLVGSAKVGITRLNYLTGELTFVEQNQTPDLTKKIKIGEGIAGKAIAEEKTILVEDFSNPESEYTDIDHYWNDTLSGIAVPIFMDKVPVRIKNDVQSVGTKKLGVLNIESSYESAFSEADQERLELLARFTAIRIEKLETDRKLNDLKPIEQKLQHERDVNRVIRSVISGITNVLKFSFVNISLVNPERTQIKTEFVVGLPDEQSEDFKQKADHFLQINPGEQIDIQADLVRTKNIEVPDPKDQRLDHETFRQFQREHLVRVFIPMIEPARGVVIGTVEAGYDRRYRTYIYEQDVQILKNFVDYALHALEQRKLGFIDRVTHEFRSPLIGIRNNTEYLKRRINEFDENYINTKLSDILLDCEMLLFQVHQLEHMLGARNSQRINIKDSVLVFRDVIIKTVNQLKPVVVENGFEMSRIRYNSGNSRKINVNTDPFKLNQVAYNLLINSIKYSRNDPSKFQIQIDLEEDLIFYIIKFKDWGIGIKEEYVSEIFEEGFRCPEAWEMNVAGTGLGLTISKKIMKQLNGDLILFRRRNPTEFHLKIPKNYYVRR